MRAVPFLKTLEQALWVVLASSKRSYVRTFSFLERFTFICRQFALVVHNDLMLHPMKGVEAFWLQSSRGRFDTS